MPPPLQNSASQEIYTTLVVLKIILKFIYRKVFIICSKFQKVYGTYELIPVLDSDSQIASKGKCLSP